MTEPKRWTIFKRRGEWDDVIVGPDVGSPGVGEPVVPLADAKAAVRAAVDARTAEIVKLLEDEADDSVWSPTTRSAIRAVAGLIARRFPNGGTNDG